MIIKNVKFTITKRKYVWNVWKNKIEWKSHRITQARALSEIRARQSILFAGRAPAVCGSVGDTAESKAARIETDGTECGGGGDVDDGNLCASAPRSGHRTPRCHSSSFSIIILSVAFTCYYLSLLNIISKFWRTRCLF